jgi:hypothetical protein
LIPIRHFWRVFCSHLSRFVSPQDRLFGRLVAFSRGHLLWFTVSSIRSAHPPPRRPRPRPPKLSAGEETFASKSDPRPSLIFNVAYLIYPNSTTPHPHLFAFSSSLWHAQTFAFSSKPHLFASLDSFDSVCFVSLHTFAAATLIT